MQLRGTEHSRGTSETEASACPRVGAGVLGAVAKCSSKAVGLSSHGKSNKLCALVVSLRFGHGGVNSLRPRVLKSSALGVSLRFRQGRSERNVFLRSKG